MSGKSNRKFPDSTMMIWSIFYQLTWLLATTQTTDTERRDLMRFFTALQCHSISINQTRDGLPLTRSRKGSNCQSSVKCKRWVWWWSLSLLLMNRVSRIFSRRMFLFFSRLPAPDLSVFYQEISTEMDKNIQIEDRHLIVHSLLSAIWWLSCLLL